MAANAAGFRIAGIAFPAHKHLNREEILARAGITGMSSLLFLDVADARARLMADPRVADANHPQALSRPAADHDHRARAVRAVAERRPRQRHRRRRHGAGAVCLARRSSTCRSSSATARRRAPRNFSPLLDRYPDIRANVRASILVAERRWNLRLKNGVDVTLPETDVERALEQLARARPRQETDCRATSPSIDLRSADRVTVRLSDAAAQARDAAAQGEGQAEEGRERVNPLHYGLTPKMKPVSPRRSALVVALDIGTSKIACLIARLTAQRPGRRAAPPQSCHRGRSASVIPARAA